ncbi:hypothetical protein PUNSTDRAFT_131536 [Punctularia strigosozonata HHB-11173 SS5]|uniref:uncharacterized protein n=1 Tax=Punctularia strigosozonata (strain HHB-11173) TaxID=741275 RepID=UPI00044166DB|nr:uncharacterized protein PUNSTDRAFT_131536 [Punctularia strigosozonata HHB-11173 SS5]EIN11374.1 hypothetical protein PUNSTDRAFT_131536 [Punctularia strigosozonata HHB-11173 SS5]
MLGHVFITRDSNTYSVSIVIHNNAGKGSGVPDSHFDLIPTDPSSFYLRSGHSTLGPQLAKSITAVPAGFFSRDPSDVDIEGLIAYRVPGLDEVADIYNLVVYFAGTATAAGGYTTVGFVNAKLGLSEKVLARMSVTGSDATYTSSATSNVMTVNKKDYTFQASII